MINAFVNSQGIILVAISVCGIVGCGSGLKDRVYKVTGTVKFADGQPVTKGTIYFDSAKYNAYGQLQPDGSFTLTTARPGDGAPAGTYRVYVQEDLLSSGAATPQVNTKHASAGTSGITEEVKPQANTFEIVVERYVAPTSAKSNK